MHRRRALKAFAAVALGFPPLIFVQRAAAQEEVAAVVVVSAILQMVSQMVQLFKESGPGIGDLLNLQAQMLASIHEELGVINGKLNMIYGKLDELKTLLDDVPDDVVVKLFTVSIAGKSGRYEELTTTYQHELAKSHNIDKAREIVVDEIAKDVIAPLREARDNLMTYHDRPSIVPSICVASFIESHAMIIAGTDKGRQSEALNRYKNWLQEALAGESPLSIENRIAALAKSQAKNSAAARSDKQQACSVTPVVTPYNYCPAGGPAVFFQCTTQRIQSRPLPIRNETVADAIRDMITRGILPPEERPTFVRVESSYLSPLLADAYCQSTEQPLANSHGVVSAQVCPSNARKPNCVGLRAEADGAAEKLTTELSRDGLSLVAYRAWQHAARECVAFLDHQLKALS